jgi:hypothetical protein
MKYLQLLVILCMLFASMKSVVLKDKSIKARYLSYLKNGYTYKNSVELIFREEEIIFQNILGNLKLGIWNAGEPQTKTDEPDIDNVKPQDAVNRVINYKDFKSIHATIGNKNTYIKFSLKRPDGNTPNFGDLSVFIKYSGNIQADTLLELFEYFKHETQNVFDYELIIICHTACEGNQRIAILIQGREKIYYNEIQKAPKPNEKEIAKYSRNKKFKPKQNENKIKEVTGGQKCVKLKFSNGGIQCDSYFASCKHLSAISLKNIISIITLNT